MIFRAAFLALMIATTAWSYTNITADSLHTLIVNNQTMVLLDIREQSDFCGAPQHIAGAVNYPWNSGVLQQRYSELPTGKTIIVICQSGTRALSAAPFLDTAGNNRFANHVVRFDGGMNTWTYPKVGCEASVAMPLSRSATKQQLTSISAAAYDINGRRYPPMIRTRQPAGLLIFTDRADHNSINTTPYLLRTN